VAVSDRRLAALTAAGALTVCVLMAVAHTWPLAADPGRLSRNDNADTMLNEWIVAWIAHQLPRAPWHLFDANIFYPEPNTLAFSEHLFVPAMIAAPALWAGASPVAAYNGLVLAGFALTAWTVWIVVTRWTGDWLAGLAAGSLAAFNAHTLTRLPHVQALHLEFLPLALLALDRLIRHGRRSDALWLALWFTLQALSSNYLLVFSLTAVALAIVVRFGEWRRHAAAFLVSLALSGAAAAVFIAPFLLPYVRAEETQGLHRSLDEVALYSASWRDYVATAGRVHYAWWSARFLDGATALFPGAAAIVLAAVGIAAARPRGVRPAGADTHRRSPAPRAPDVDDLVGPRVRMCAIVALGAFLLSFGPALPGYRWLYRAIPILQGIRGAARFGELMLMAVAFLAGFGTAGIRRRMPGASGTIVACALILTAHAEAWGVPAVYDNLARDPRAVVAEFPIASPGGFQGNAVYELNSTRHWRPIVNGYSGHVPRSYVEAYEALRVLPEPRALAMLRRLGVTHVVIHEAEFVDLKGRAVYDAVLRSDALDTVVASEGIRIMRVR
jgi:hypothetical protein